MAQENFRNVMILHSSTQVGEVIPEYTDSTGKTWTSHVDDKGLFIVVKLRDDIQAAREVWQAIKDGALRAFSIGGSKLKRYFKTLGGKLVSVIDKLDLHEISLVFSGANPAAKFIVLKAGCTSCEPLSDYATSVTSTNQGEPSFINLSYGDISDVSETQAPVTESQTRQEEPKEAAEEQAPVSPASEQLLLEIKAGVDKLVSVLEGVQKAIEELDKKVKAPDKEKYPYPYPYKYPYKEPKKEGESVPPTPEITEEQIEKLVEEKLQKRLEDLTKRIEKRSEAPQEKKEEKPILDLTTFKTDPNEAWAAINQLRWRSRR